MLDRSTVIQELTKVIDPESGVAITELDLVEEVKVKDGSVSIQYHLTSNYCPPQFALAIGSDIKSRVTKLTGVKKFNQTIKGHFLADDINEQLNK